MGAWAAGLFDDDTACDLRDEFKEMLASGLTVEQATAELERRYEPASDPVDLEPVFWIALAAVQHSWGRLMPSVRDRAVEIIDTGRDVERFFDDTDIRAKRQAVLEKFKRELLGPPRPARRIPRPSKKAETSWKVGDVFRYRLLSGRSCLFRVTGHRADKGGRYAVFEVLREDENVRLNAFGVALTPGLSNKRSGKHQAIMVPRGLEPNERVMPTEFGSAVAGPIANWLRVQKRDVHASATSIMTPAQLDKNLKEFFDLE